MIYILGGEGFIGSAFVRLFGRLKVPYKALTRETYSEYIGTDCDLLINANGNSKKFLAERDPCKEFDLSVRTVQHSLCNFRYSRYVFVSSGDVYLDPSSPETTQEDSPVTLQGRSRYGLHKLIAEQLVCGYARDWLVFRLGGVVGPGLKKNPVFDLLNDAPVWLSAESEMQFIHSDSAAELIWAVIETRLSRECVNVAARGVVQLAQLRRSLKSSSLFRDGAPTIRYELGLDKLRSLVRREVPTTHEELHRFVNRYRATGIQN